MIRRILPALLLGLLLACGGASGAGAGRSVVPADEAAGPTAPLTIVFTGETRGNLVPCSCPDGAWGGLARRVGFVKARRASAPGPFLALDTGGFLPVGAVPLRNDPQAEVALVTLLSESLLLSGADVLALEPGERAYLAQIVPTVWPRLADRTLDSAPPSPPRVVSWSGTPVAILALDEGVDDATIEARADEARSLAEVVVVLARADGVSGRRIAVRSQADLVIFSYGVRTEAPVRLGRSWVVGAGREGKELGEIQLERGPEGIEVSAYRLVPMDEAVIPDPATDERVRRLLDDFGPGWRALVSPIE